VAKGLGVERWDVFALFVHGCSQEINNLDIVLKLYQVTKHVNLIEEAVFGE